MALRGGLSLDGARGNKFVYLPTTLLFFTLNTAGTKCKGLTHQILTAGSIPAVCESPKVHDIALQCRETPGPSAFMFRRISQLITKPSWSQSSKYFDANAWGAFKSLITVTMLIMFMWEKKGRKGIALCIVLICHLEPFCYTSHGRLFSLLHFLTFGSQIHIKMMGMTAGGPWDLNLMNLLGIAWEPQKHGSWKSLGK